MDERSDLGADFAIELDRLYTAAGRPALAALVRRGSGHTRLNTKTISDWLNGKSVPKDPGAVAFLARHLEALATGTPDYEPRGVEWWLDFRERAAAQRRPSRAADPGSGTQWPGEPASRTALQLTRVLYGIPELRHRRTRDTVLDSIKVRLDPDLRVRRSDDIVADLGAMVAACLHRRGGPRAIVDAVQDALPDSWRTVTLESAVAQLAPTPPLLSDEQRADLLQALRLVSLADVDLPGIYQRATDYGDTLRCARSMLAVVAELESRVSPFPLFAFVELLAGVAGRTARQHLHRWVDGELDLVPPERHEDLRRLRHECATHPLVLGRRTHMLTRLTPVSDDFYRIQSWICVGGASQAVNHEPGQALTLEDAQAWLAWLIDQYNSGALAPESQPLLEFFLPEAELNLPIDSWPTESDDGTLIPVGVRFAVVVRPADRVASAVWRRRWQTLAHSRERSTETVTRWVPDTAAEKVADLDQDETWVVTAVTCPEMSCAPEAITPLLDVGTPAVLWVRDRHDHEEAVRHLRETITAWEVMQLPDRVQGVRRVAWEEDGRIQPHPLVLLWDDPTRLPPGEPVWAAPTVRGEQ